MVRKKKTAGGIYFRNGDALHKLREVERELGFLNNEILRFFGVDESILKVSVGRRSKKRR